MIMIIIVQSKKIQLLNQGYVRARQVLVKYGGFIDQNHMRLRFHFSLFSDNCYKRDGLITRLEHIIIITIIILRMSIASRPFSITLSTVN